MLIYTPAPRKKTLEQEFDELMVARGAMLCH